MNKSAWWAWAIKNSICTIVLEAAYENENDLKRNEAQIINILSRKLME